MVKATSRPVSVVLLLTLLAPFSGSCKKKKVTETTQKTPTTETKTARVLPPAVDKILPNGYGTQDFLIHLDLQVVNREKNEGESFYQEVLKRAEDGAGQVQAFRGGLEFRPTSSIRGVVRDKAGRVLPSISVNFGLLSIQAGQVQPLLRQLQNQLPAGVKVTSEDLERASVLVEFTTADLNKAPINVQVGDVSDLDISFVRGIKPGDHLRSKHLLGQTYPPADAATEASLTPQQIFLSRWTAGQVGILGIPGEGVALATAETVEVIHGSTIRRYPIKPYALGQVTFKAITGCRTGAGLGAAAAIWSGVGVVPASLLGCLVGGLAANYYSASGATYNTVEIPCWPIQGGGAFIEGRHFASGERTMERTYETCSEATGDVHMETFDGQRYDLQAAGEFVAVKDAGGQVTIQIRLEPPPGSRRVSITTAVAARVDGAKVAIHLHPQPQLFVADKAINLERGWGMRLGKAGGITFTGTSWVIAWPDGTVAWITSGGHFNLFVHPGSAAGRLVGLFGNADGKVEGDLVARDGVVLPTEISFKEMYGRFAESWRISQNESLFHYAGSESTATYTDRSIPTENVTLGSLAPAARAEAERLCRAAGITAPGPLANCIIDLSVTGDRSFLLSAALSQAASRDPVGSPTSAGTGKQPGSLMVSGTGKDFYYVFDAAGKQRLIDGRRTDSVTELLPGTYMVVLNETRQRLELAPGQQAVVEAGSVTVSGTGEDLYYVYDATGKEQLGDWRRTNSVTELLPGTYVVKVGERTFTISVQAGQRATIK